MPKRHVSMRIDEEIVLSLNAMADHRDLDFTGISTAIFDAALRARQRVCSQTHRNGTRCGECGMLAVPADSNPLEHI
jgi:hypothetical protein